MAFILSNYKYIENNNSVQKTDTLYSCLYTLGNQYRNKIRKVNHFKNSKKTVNVTNTLSNHNQSNRYSVQILSLWLSYNIVTLMPIYCI